MVRDSTMLAIERRLYFTLHAFAERRKAKRAAATAARTQPGHLRTGERGEDEAFFYLRRLGYTVVARRWRTERLRGDLDLLAWDGGTLVIFEVKTRTARDLYPADEQVDDEKREMLRRMGRAYVRQFPERHRECVPVRFDVLAVYLLEGGTEFEHFRDSFSS